MKTNAEYYNNLRTEIHSLISSQARRVLDVGCGFGVLGSALKEELGAEVWGVEMEPNCAVRASKVLDQFLKGPIESHLDNLPESYFDVIIFADVLEHLYNPWKVLKDIRTKIAKGGEVIASIPNVGHWFVIKQLLQGRFAYENHGLLDITHIRFFTRESMLSMFQGAKFQVTFCGTVTAEWEPIPDEIVAACAALGFDSSQLREESDVVQFVIKAIVEDRT